ncbi:hypothetical protein DAEQUDRAFT_731833 [Daedalea quercina L-15889]|uniref:Uncharacterized protein n=1 Tax=Daedalea quercina L-15889 TaxID=1314783 RepID=A0A165M0X5_9APHY|nr:hypothetical protein DAEQUDRAFT_731833 [Daedalea quercina L-15889]
MFTNAVYYSQSSSSTGMSNAWSRPAVAQPSTQVQAAPIGCLTRPTVVKPMKPVGRPVPPQTHKC